MREQLGRAADESFLLSGAAAEHEFLHLAGRGDGVAAGVWVSAGDSTEERAQRPDGDRYEAGRPAGGGEADGGGFPAGSDAAADAVSGPGGGFRGGAAAGC